MKKFTISALSIAVFFIGLGSLINQVGASFQSDAQALDLLKQARRAIGGEANVNAVRGLTATGKIVKTFDLGDRQHSEQGDWEINLQLPNRLSKTIKLRREGANGGEEFGVKNVIVHRRAAGENRANGAETKALIVKKGDGAPVVADNLANGGEPQQFLINRGVETHVAGAAERIRHSELFRVALALLAGAPEDAATSYKFAGEAAVDGNACAVVEAVKGDSSVKLYLDRASHLPRMISFQANKPLIFRFDKDDRAGERQKFRVIERAMTTTPETAEFQIKFSDYRAVNGVLLPFKWTQTVGGAADETVDVTNYEINPANIADKFQDGAPKVSIRTEKKSQ